jgi:hypothetical protein
MLAVEHAVKFKPVAFGMQSRSAYDKSMTLTKTE